LPEEERVWFIDWLRMLAVFLLIPFHAAIAYVYGPSCYVKGPMTSMSMKLISGFIGMWFMPLLFLISGISTFYSLKKRNVNAFIGERLLKLMLPLGVGSITVIPVLTYYGALQHGFCNSFFRFYPKFFSSYFNWGHFWFLPYLFVYTLITLPLFIYWRDKPSRFIGALISKTNGWAIYLPLFWFILIEASLRVKWPGNQTLINDWANFLYYLGLYLLGFLYSQHQSFAQAVTERFPVSLTLALSAALIIFYIDLTKVNIIWSYNLKTLMVLMLHGINTWFWLLALIGLGSKRFNFSNRFIKYANDACFPYYILHYLPVTILGYYIVNQHLPVSVKFGIVTLSSILITLILYEILFKRVNIIRILFGFQPLS
jgi:hypothetical protein